MVIDSLIDSLITFLRARLDEDEAAARAAASVAGPDWRHDHFWPEDGSSATTMILSASGSPLADTLHRDDEEMAPHIALHDPARVLREVEAKRKRLALYLDAKEAFASALKDAPPGDDPATAHSYVRERINVNQASGRFTALEVSVRLDAAVWDGHPDFRPGWRP